MRHTRQWNNKRQGTIATKLASVMPWWVWMKFSKRKFIVLCRLCKLCLPKVEIQIGSVSSFPFFRIICLWIEQPKKLGFSFAFTPRPHRMRDYLRGAAPAALCGNTPTDNSRFHKLHYQLDLRHADVTLRLTLCGRGVKFLQKEFVCFVALVRSKAYSQKIVSTWTGKYTFQRGNKQNSLSDQLTTNLVFKIVLEYDVLMRATKTSVLLHDSVSTFADSIMKSMTKALFNYPLIRQNWSLLPLLGLMGFACTFAAGNLLYAALSKNDVKWVHILCPFHTERANAPRFQEHYKLNFEKKLFVAGVKLERNLFRPSATVSRNGLKRFLSSFTPATKSFFSKFNL